MAGLNISLSLLGLNRRQTCSSEKITTWAYISFWFPPSAVVLPALYSFLHRQQNKRNYTTPISEMSFTFFMRKTCFEKNLPRWMSAKWRCKLQAPIKGGNFGAKFTPLSLLIGRIIFVLFFFFFFHVSKPSFVFAYENLRHSSLVSISQYVCLILLFGTVHVVCQIVSCISGYGWIRPLYIILAFFWAF